MPSKSEPQKRLMRAVAHSPKFAKKVNIPQSVGEEFNAADEAQEAKGGGQFNLPKTTKPMKTSMRNC